MASKHDIIIRICSDSTEYEFEEGCMIGSTNSQVPDGYLAGLEQCRIITIEKDTLQRDQNESLCGTLPAANVAVSTQQQIQCQTVARIRIKVGPNCGADELITLQAL